MLNKPSLSSRRKPGPSTFNNRIPAFAETANRSIVIAATFDELVKALKDAEHNRPLSKLAPDDEMQGGAERRTRAYSKLSEDSSTAPTQQIASGVEFRKRSNLVTLPPNAIFYMGLEHICAMLELAKQGIPEAHERFILDIQDDAGLCLRAFKTNLQNFLFRGSTETFKKLDSIAKKLGKVILCK